MQKHKKAKYSRISEEIDDYNALHGYYEEVPEVNRFEKKVRDLRKQNQEGIDWYRGNSAYFERDRLLSDLLDEDPTEDSFEFINDDESDEDEYTKYWRRHYWGNSYI